MSQLETLLDYRGTGQTPSSATVTTASTEILSAGARRWAVITNLGTDGVFIAVGQTAILNAGMYLAPGGVMNFTGDAGTKQAVNGITRSGSSLVIYQEGT